jgi:glycosyltransferase involved in cell wall biosynthesis
MHRLKGARIVWTVHNVRGHDRKNIALERVLLWSVARLVHGVIFLSVSTRASAYREIPALTSKPFRIIPHGLYGVRSAKTSSQARAVFGVPPDCPVVGFLGDIRRYKGLDLLLSAFEQTVPSQVTLFVAGVFLDPNYGTAIRTCLAGLAAKGHSIAFHEERLNDSALADAVRACDIVVMPYRAVSNSGLALLVLENRCRILASNAPVFLELQQELGAEWVETFCGTLTGARLLAALNNPPADGAQRIDAFCASRSWPDIGAQTVDFYFQLARL